MTLVLPAMKLFVEGQRWISHMEPELGIGIVLETAGRRVRIFFAAAEVIREYTPDAAPLKRVIFQEGDPKHEFFLLLSGRVSLEMLVQGKTLRVHTLEAGDEPFGSVLVSATGDTLFEDHNHVAGGDHTQHPEFAIARWAAARRLV